MVASSAMMAPMASNCQCDLRIIEQGKIYLQFSCMTRQTNFSYITELGPNTDPIHNGSKNKQWSINNRLTCGHRRPEI